ncbi:MAG TPA: type II toxin-antitoxin system PemK/MazF family toxin [Candidatus Diapherotrites archaeon]|uniref:Type II toxin-antitoxin system PemK/MazF family toxin n=1 Tax=Candidatus Iainarchaeum sp. TaxID=3101447 RepID=A0A7J4IV58_9ARCH|nr:type II toxin-antitoxin system PemK/MazF family toxin [Candidatus Diapherotrites archaeon]
MTYKQAEMVLIPFPFSDLSSSKKRPALIISSDTFNNSSQDIICCLVTTNPKSDEYTVSISEADVESGKLHFDSTIKPYRLFTIDKKLVMKSLCVLKAGKLGEVILKLQKIIPPRK